MLFDFADSCWLAVMGIVHKSVVGSFNPFSIILLLYIILQCFLLNVTVHPASHSTRTPISDAIDRLGTMCPVSVSGRPGMLMSQQCVDLIFDPSGRLIVSGFVATCLFSTGVPSMMKIAVAPVSMMACDNFCRLLCPGAPKRARAVAAIESCRTGGLGMAMVLFVRYFTALVVFDAITVMSSSSTSSCVV